MIRRVIVAEVGPVLSDLGDAFQGVRMRWILWALVSLGLIAYLLTGVYVVAPGEAAVVRRFGAVIAPRVDPGLHYRAPWPIGRVDIVDVNTVRRETVGVVAAEPGHEHPEPPSKLQTLSGDTNVVNLEIIVQYRIRDPAAFLFNVHFASYRLVRPVQREAVTSVVTTQPVDAILTTERQALQVAILAAVQRRLDAYNSGPGLVGIDVQRAFPPDEVADAFVAVNSAREERARAVNEARGHAGSLIPRARGEARRAVAQATGEAAGVLARANGEARAFADMLDQYRSYSRAFGPQVTRYRLYLEKMERVLSRARVYAVDTSNGRAVNIRLLDEAADARGDTAPGSR